MLISVAIFRRMAFVTLLALCSSTIQASIVTPKVPAAPSAIFGQKAAGGDGIFRNGFDFFPIRISPEGWLNAWIGARMQFLASGDMDEGQPPEVVWSTGDPTLVQIDQTGFATALKSTLNTTLTATSGPYSDSVSVIVAFDDSSGPGVMYTMYLARSDTAPALLVGGTLQTPEILGDTAWADPVPPWPASRPTIEKFDWEGDYIGLLTDMANGAGTLRAKGRVEDWAILALANVTDFDLVRNSELNAGGDPYTALYVVVLRNDNAMLMKKGVHGGWSTLGTSVGEFKVEPNPYGGSGMGLIRIGVLNLDGSFHVKDEMNGAWTTLAAAGMGIREFQIANNHIAVLFESGLFRAKEGINGPWVTLAADGSSIRSFQLEGDRIGLLMEDGLFRVKDGINGPWTTLAAAATGASSFQLELNRIGVLYDDGLFRAKDGINGAWRVLGASGIDSFQFQGNRIGMLSGNDFRVKTGLDGAWSDVWNPNGEVSQYRLAVDVPTPAARTTIGSYNSQQTLCHNQGHPLCYQDLEPVIPPPAWYGRFCGAGHPGNWNWAWAQGPIDAFDRTCIHHDLASEWYPEITGLGPQTCIVRYALRYSRLTNNGALLTHGADSNSGWNAGWASHMPNLKAALDTYFDYVLIPCSDSVLDDFIVDTASKN